MRYNLFWINPIPPCPASITIFKSFINYLLNNFMIYFNKCAHIQEYFRLLKKSKNKF